MFGNRDIGIDLGTSSVLIYIRGKGVVLREPSVGHRYKGREDPGRRIHCQQDVGQNPRHTGFFAPLQDGVISDHEITKDAHTSSGRPLYDALAQAR